MTSYFCDGCGSTLYRMTSHTDQAVALMIGCIDGTQRLEDGKAEVELFTRYRPAWMKPIDTAEQLHDGFDEAYFKSLTAKLPNAEE